MITSDDVVDSVLAYCQDCTDGYRDALDVFADLKGMLSVIQDVLKEVEPLALEEAQKYPKTFEYHNLKFTRTEGRRMYKFDHIKEWVKQNEVLSQIEEDAKEAAQQAEKGSVIADSEGIVKDAAIITFTKSSLSVK